MSQKSPFYCLITCLLFLSLALPGFAFAKDDKFSFRVWGQVSPFLSGDAGSGSGAPRYDDAFNTGLGAGAELSWRFSNRLSGLVGIGYENYSGDTHEGISFDRLAVIPVYLRGAEEYTGLLTCLGYEKIFEAAPPFTEEFLAQYPTPFPTQDPEFLIFGFQKKQ